MNLKSIEEEFAAAKAAFQEKATSALEAAFKEAFDSHPEIEAITWHQFTPYFNDGETCEFRVGEFYVTNTKNSGDVSTWGELETEDESVFLVDRYSDKEKKYSNVWEIEKFFDSDIGNDIALAAYGDHVMVFVTRDSISIDEFEHD